MGFGDRNRRRGLVINEPLQRKILVGVGLVPTVGLVVCAITVATLCRGLLAEAASREVELPALVPLFLAVLGFTLVAGTIFVFQALRFSHRIAGPAYRLTKSLERIRKGDISFRVSTRRGDHLTGLVTEVNHLLDWLNANPPAGVKLGTDMVHMAGEVEVVDEQADRDVAAQAAERVLEAVGP